MQYRAQIFISLDSYGQVSAMTIQHFPPAGTRAAIRLNQRNPPIPVLNLRDTRDSAGNLQNVDITSNSPLPSDADLVRIVGGRYVEQVRQPAVSYGHAISRLQGRVVSLGMIHVERWSFLTHSNAKDEFFDLYTGRGYPNSPVYESDVSNDYSTWHVPPSFLNDLPASEGAGWRNALDMTNCVGGAANPNKVLDQVYLEPRMAFAPPCIMRLTCMIPDVTTLPAGTELLFGFEVNSQGGNAIVGVYAEQGRFSLQSSVITPTANPDSQLLVLAQNNPNVYTDFWLYFDPPNVYLWEKNHTGGAMTLLGSITIGSSPDYFDILNAFIANESSTVISGFRVGHWAVWQRTLPQTGGVSVLGSKASYKYLTSSDGTYVTVYDSNGNIVYSPTLNHAAAINWALANVSGTSFDMVAVKGSIIPEVTIIIKKKYTVLDLTACSINQPNGANRDILALDASLQNLAQYTPVYIEVRGGVVNGNCTNQASGNGFSIGSVSGHEIRELTLSDILLLNCYGYGLQLSYVGEVDTKNVRIESSLSGCGGINLIGVYDSIFSGTSIDVYQVGLGLDSNTRTNTFVNVFIGGGDPGLDLEGAYENSFSNTLVQDCYAGGVILNNANGNTFNGGHVYGCSNSNPNTFSGIIIKGTSSGNIINGVAFPDDGVVHGQKYAVEEQDSADYNNVNGNVAYNVAPAFHLIGVHSIKTGNVPST